MGSRGRRRKIEAIASGKLEPATKKECVGEMLVFHAGGCLRLTACKGN
jgi:hypothetical protein